MRKFIFILFLGIMILSSTSSCVTTAYAQDIEIYDEDSDVSIVIRYGTPYYFEGSLLYYFYNGWYYYPYFYNNYWYYYRYSRPLLPPLHGHKFRPKYGERPYFKHHRNYNIHRTHHQSPNVHQRNNMPRRGTVNDRNFHRNNTDRPFIQQRSNSGSLNRPSAPMRSSRNRIAPPTRSNGSRVGGSFGGKR